MLTPNAQQDAKAATTRSPEEIQALRRAYYERIGQKNMAPLWEVLRDLVPAEPVTPFVPALWRFDDFKPLVFEGGGLITAKEANLCCRVKSRRRIAIRPARSASSSTARAPTPRSTGKRP